MAFPLEEMIIWYVPFILGNYRGKITWDSLKSRKETVNVELKMDDMGIFKGKIGIGKGNTLLKEFFSVSSISFGILKSVLLLDLKIFQN